jgi:acetyl-CoA acetyltransferase
VMIDGAIVAFRPVKIYSEDYAEQEYGVTSEELDQFVARTNKELDANRKAGRLKPFTGKLKRA